MPIYKPFICLIFIFSLSFTVFSQDISATNAKIRKSVEQHDYATAIKDLMKIKSNDPKIFAANNYDYLLARLSEKQGDYAAASANYQTVVDRGSILKNYAKWHLSQIMRSTGNLMLEKIYLQELLLDSDQSLLKDAIRKRLVRNNFESKNYSEAIKLLSGQTSFASVQKDETLIENVKEQIPFFDEKQPREDLVLLAQSYLQIKQSDKAREIFNQLVNNPPKKDQPDDYAIAGVKGLDKLEIGDENFGKSVAKLSDEEHYKRAEIYQFNRNFPLARLHYQAIVDNFPTSIKVAVSLYQIGRGYVQERNDEKAIETFEQLRSKFPEEDLAASALYQIAGSYANLDKTNESVSRYQKYIAENEDADNLERAYLNIIDAYRDAKDYKNALQWCNNTREKFKDESGEAIALFSQARIYLSQENWQQALNTLFALKESKKLNNLNIAGGTNSDEVNFLVGFASEKLSRFDEAIETYLTIDDGLKNYYGWRSTERLNDLLQNAKTAKLIEQKFNKYEAISNETLINSNAGQIKNAAHKAFRLTDNKEKRNKLLARIPRAYSLLPTYEKTPNANLTEFGRKNILQTIQKDQIKSHKSIADELLFLGLYDEGTPELETALRKDLTKNTGSFSDFSSDTAYTLAVFYKRGDMANRAITYAEPLWKKIPNDYQIDLIPREQIELLYPKPYQASLNKYGNEKQVDPRFMLSIMRQESRYQADVKSYAAARGLMQFISTTANDMAVQMKIEGFQQDDLYNPPTAIRFGSHYINKIFNDFPNQPQAVAASYNGGEDRMMRWFKRSNTDDPDRYVSEVVFFQTKDYVFKVMANYRVYKTLYDENLRKIK